MSSAQADFRAKTSEINKELLDKHDQLVSNPAQLRGFIDKNAKLGLEAKSAAASMHTTHNDAIMAGIVVEQSKKLTSLVAMTPTGFMKGLIQKYNSGEGVDWVKFGRHASAYFREPPAALSMYHFLGPFDVGPKIRKVSAPTVKRRQDTDLKQQETVVAQKEGMGGSSRGDKRNATLQNADRHNTLFQDLKKLERTRVVARDPETCREWELEMLPMVSSLLDPYSYTQSVENLFYFSRLVKEGWCGVFWARSLTGAGDKPGVAVAGKPWEPYIIAYTSDELKDIMSSKRYNPVPDDAVLAVGSEKGGATSSSAAGGGGAASSSSTRQTTLNMGKSATEVKNASKVLGRSQQFIVELDYDSWKRLLKEKNVREPALSHRKTSDSTAPMAFKFFEDAKPVEDEEKTEDEGEAAPRRKRVKKEEE